jgi:hypothetical protein
MMMISSNLSTHPKIPLQMSVNHSGVWNKMMKEGVVFRRIGVNVREICWFQRDECVFQIDHIEVHLLMEDILLMQ